MNSVALKKVLKTQIAYKQNHKIGFKWLSRKIMWLWTSLHQLNKKMPSKIGHSLENIKQEHTLALQN